MNGGLRYKMTSRKTRAIILAAGIGGRLSPATENTPKALLDLGHGITVLDRQLEAIKACNIHEVRVVVGYEAEQIETKLIQRADLGLDTGIFYNPFYRVTNNLVSLWMARPFMDHDFIMINGDDVFRKSVLQKLIRTSGDFVAVISRKKCYDSDDTKIITNGPVIARIDKNLPLDQVNAEWAGICLVRGSARARFVDLMDSLIRNPLLREGPPHYLSLIQGLIDSGLTLEYLEIPVEAWAEIDYQKDLDFVQAKIAQFDHDQ